MRLKACSCAATSDLLDGVCPGEAGVGFLWSFEPVSPYRGETHDSDFMPGLFRYDSRYFYLQSDRVGLKLDAAGVRYEAFPAPPAGRICERPCARSMVGMEQRSSASDVGVGLRLPHWRGLRIRRSDAQHERQSHGTELRAGYRYERWWAAWLRWRPYVTLGGDADDPERLLLGVRPEEATPERPAYAPGAGLNVELGAFAALHRVAARWQVLAAAGARWSSGVRDSPVVGPAVRRRSSPSGLRVGFAPYQAHGRPATAHLRVGYGHQAIAIFSWWLPCNARPRKRRIRPASACSISARC